jgi:hypothetical protein
MGIFRRETVGPELAEVGVAEAEVAEAEVAEAEVAETEVAEAEVEGEIREFVRREVGTAPRRPENEGRLIADNISSLLERVSASSLQEIDALINDLTILREKLHEDGRRVHRQIVQYASLSQTAMQSTRAIAESLGQWKKREPAAPRVDEGA